jgi:hypothetical protein
VGFKGVQRIRSLVKERYKLQTVCSVECGFSILVLIKERWGWGIEILVVSNFPCVSIEILRRSIILKYHKFSLNDLSTLFLIHELVDEFVMSFR